LINIFKDVVYEKKLGRYLGYNKAYGFIPESDNNDNGKS
jgi:hypothetical protein